MNIRFHPPEDPAEYAQRLLLLLVQAALPQIRPQLEAPSAAGEAGRPPQ